MEFKEPGEEWDEDIGSEPIPLGQFVYTFVMSNMHNMLVYLGEELDKSGTHVVPKDELAERLLEVPDEGDDDGSNES